MNTQNEVKEAKVPRGLKFQEAIRRMEYLEIHQDAIKAFKDENKVPLSLSSDPELYGVRRNSVDRIADFEKQHNALVYYVIFTPTSIGDMESYLFVSDYQEEWESDWDDIHEGYALSWVNNLTYLECSEFGTISFIKTEAGTLRRVG